MQTAGADVVLRKGASPERLLEVINKLRLADKSSATQTQPQPSPPPPEPTIEIDVYSDSACTQPMSSVSWGSIEAGSSVNRVLYVKNSGDDTVTLSLHTDNWDPAGAEDDLHLSWDYDGSALDSGAALKVTLTLSVDGSTNGINDFSFDIIITGSAS